MDRVLSKVTSMISELEVMGVVLTSDPLKRPLPTVSKGSVGLEPTHVAVSMTANMLMIGVGAIQFPVHIKAFDGSAALLDTYMNRFTSDSVMLGAHSMHVIRTSHSYDRLNQSNGVALLQRMIDMQLTKSTTQLQEYRSPVCWLNQAHNAGLLIATNQFAQEGLTVLGNSALISGPRTDADGADTMCPICLETRDVSFITLECSHVFCVDCITNHMLLATTGSQCPMCREHIRPSINACPS
jgi:hypothetical protein